MRAFLIVALCTSLACAKPQYNYPVPSVPGGSYGVPQVQYSSAGQGIQERQAANYRGQSQTIGGSYQTGGDFLQTGGFGFGGGTGGGISTAGASGASNGQGFTGGSGVPGRQTGVQSSASIGTGGTLVQKHIYVHVAPPEPEEVRHRQPISVGQSTKHYKIIFIKAPSYETYQQQVLQQQAQNEEKTLVYVLVKKPEEQADITIPTAAPTAPSKPEVYFIRYRAKSEAGNQLSGKGPSSLSLSSEFSSSSQQLSQGSQGTQLRGEGVAVEKPLSLSSEFSSSSQQLSRPHTKYGPPN